MRAPTNRDPATGGRERRTGPLPAVLVLAAVALVAACGGEPAAPARSTFEGEIVERNPAFGAPAGTDVLLRIHVKEDPDDPGECGIIFSIREGTPIVVDAAPFGGGSTEDLATGALVRVVFSGPLLESCPLQGGADLVEVLRRA